MTITLKIAWKCPVHRRFIVTHDNTNGLQSPGVPPATVRPNHVPKQGRFGITAGTNRAHGLKAQGHCAARNPVGFTKYT